ncbi:transposase, partial [Paracraurococcus ruber]|uniref:transposase n=1 Tax=Paracraurococcus ruber TaxID=77675 RepID=UPI001F01CF40
MACGVTDMRSGMDRLSALVQQSLGANPFDGAVYLFRGRKGDRATFCILSLRDLAAAWRHLSDTLEDSSAGAPSRAVGRR